MGTCLLGVTLLLLSCICSIQTTESPVISTNLGGFYNLADSFINSVEPGDLPFDDITALIVYVNGTTDTTSDGIWDHVRPILLYCVSFVVLFIIGVIFLIIMPIVGCCFCCCRCCCDNCGAKPSKEPKSLGYCICYSLFIFVIAVFFLAGAALYIANDFESYADLRKNLVGNTDKQLDNIFDYSDSTLNEIYGATVGKVGPLNTQVLSAMDDTVDSVIKMARHESGMEDIKTLNDTTEALLLGPIDNVTANADQLRTSSAVLRTQLTQEGFSESATPDIFIALDNYTSVPVDVLTGTMVALKTVLMDLQSSVANDANYNKVDGKLQLFRSDYGDSVKNLNTTIADTYNSLVSSYNDASDLLNDVKNSSQTYTDQLSDTFAADVFDTYEWTQWVVFAVILPILLILLMVDIGLIVGCCACCNRDTRRPAKTTCLSNCSGNCLLGSAIVAFVFSFILMLITIIIFIIGFTSEAVLCRSLFPDPSKLFSFVKDQAQFESGSILDQINVTTAIVGCKNNDSFYRSFQVEKFFDVNATMAQLPQNISINPMDFMKFDETDVYQLEPTTKLTITNIVAKLGKLMTPFEEFVSNETERNQLLNAGVTILFTSDISPSLRQEVTAFQTNATDALNNDKSVLQQLQNLNDSATSLIQMNDSDIVTTITGKANKTVDDTIKQQTASITAVSSESIKYLTDEVGRCRIVYDTYQNFGEILCSQLLHPLQGIWVALGWCLFFFIPFIVFAVKITPYLKQMDFKGDSRYERFLPKRMGRNRVSSETQQHQHKSHHHHHHEQPESHQLQQQPFTPTVAYQIPASDAIYVIPRVRTGQ